MPTIEKSKVKEIRPDGSRVILPEVETRVRNRRHDFEYESEEHAVEDINNPETDTTEDDIARDTTLRVLMGVDSTGDAG